MHFSIQSIYNGQLGAIRYSNLEAIQLAFVETKALSLKFVLQGNETYYINGERYTLKPNELLLFGQGRAYEATTPGKSTNKGLCIDLDNTFLQSARLDLFGEERLFNLDTEQAPLKLYNPSTELRTQIQTIYQLINVPELLYSEEALNNLMYKYLLLEKDLVQKIYSIPTLKRSVQEEIFRKLIQAQNFIHDNKTQVLSLEKMARVAGLSQFYFQRLFKKVFHQSPAQYLEKVRMEEAIQLLKTGKYSITEIAYSLGYSDLAYFSRRFKRFFGSSPKQIQAQVK